MNNIEAVLDSGKIFVYKVKQRNLKYVKKYNKLLSSRVLIPKQYFEEKNQIQKILEKKYEVGSKI